MSSVIMDSADGTRIPRLLLVVSDDLIRDIFRKLFERSGYQTVAVEKAKDGLETLRDECFDVILCDFDLHDSTGVDFFESAKKICPHRINILMTTPGDPVNVYEVKKLKIHHIIEKPFCSHFTVFPAPCALNFSPAIAKSAVHIPKIIIKEIITA